MVTKEELIEAVLNYSQRIKKSINMRRNKNRLSRARDRARKRLATQDALQKRARRAATVIVRRIVAGKLGLEYNDLAVSQKMMIDAKVAQKKSLVNRLSRKLMPVIIKKERERLASFKANQHIREEHGAGFESTKKLVDKYKKETPGQ
jgi:hypothetical protein